MSSMHMDIKELASALGVSVAHAHKLVTDGRIPAINVGVKSKSIWRINRDDYAKFIEEERTRTASRFGGAA